MATFLFNDIIFGPVKSRRLGRSLGINLLPAETKFCNFNCLYCECGWTCNNASASDIPSREEVSKLLAEKLKEMDRAGESPDAITYAGNGEPTLHPHFTQILADTIALRDRHAPKAAIAVLSNATTLHKAPIREALSTIEQPILKLDSAIESTYQLVNQPLSGRTVEQIIQDLQSFKNPVILQTLFLKGHFKDQFFDNTNKVEVEALITAYHRIKPKQIMIYTFARDTPLDSLEKIDLKALENIALRLQKEGFQAEVSG